MGDVKKIQTITISEISDYFSDSNQNEDVLAFETEFEDIRQQDYPAKIDALMMVLCVEGGGKIGIDMADYDVEPNSLIVIHPQNYISFSRVDENMHACVVTCSARVVEAILPKLTDLLPVIMHHRSKPVYQLTPAESQSMLNYYKLLKIKLNEEKTPYLSQKLICILQAALYELMDIRVKDQNNEVQQKTRRQEIMAKFIIYVCENFKSERQVSFYANKLCITAKHLSAVVKELSGRTAGDWIENYVVMEAKVLLKSTDMTIQEIASQLNFSNQSIFGKYFKHQTGVSPSEYRATNSE